MFICITFKTKQSTSLRLIIIVKDVNILLQNVHFVYAVAGVETEVNI